MSNQPTWLRSSKCDASTCTEVTTTPRGMIMLRNSQDPGRLIWMTPAEWDAFAAGVKSGEFDHLTRA
jgi:predicted secreted Zn-dependent protease